MHKDKSREECEYILKWLTKRQPVRIDFLRKLIQYNKEHMLDIIRENRLAVISLNDKALIIDSVVEDSETIIENFIKDNEKNIKTAICLTHGGDYLAGKYVFLEQIEQIPIGKQHGNLSLLLPNMKPSSNIGAVNKDEIANNFEFHKHILMPFFKTVNNLNSKKNKRNRGSKPLLLFFKNFLVVFF